MSTSSTTTKRDLASIDDRSILMDLRDQMLASLPDSIRRMVLFGSRARGDFDASSDLDVLVVLSECDSAALERARTARYEVMQRWQFEPLISLLLLSEQDWQDLSKHSVGLKHNIEREGLTVWPRCSHRLLRDMFDEQQLVGCKR